jgi:hypothetical protein
MNSSLSSAMSARHTITMTKKVININNGRTLVKKDVGLTTRVHLKKWKLKQQFKYLAEALRHES